MKLFLPSNRYLDTEESTAEHRPFLKFPRPESSFLLISLDRQSCLVCFRLPCLLFKYTFSPSVIVFSGYMSCTSPFEPVQHADRICYLRSLPDFWLKYVSSQGHTQYWPFHGSLGLSEFCYWLVCQSRGFHAVCEYRQDTLI